MTTQQRAATAHTALINFFGQSGTVSSILQMVQPTQPQASIGQSQQLANDLRVMVSDNKEGTSFNLQTSTEHNNTHNNSQNTPYTIPHISRTTSTETYATSSFTFTQQD